MDGGWQGRTRPGHVLPELRGVHHSSFIGRGDLELGPVLDVLPQVLGLERIRQPDSRSASSGQRRLLPQVALVVPAAVLAVDGAEVHVLPEPRGVPLPSSARPAAVDPEPPTAHYFNAC